MTWTTLLGNFDSSTGDGSLGSSVVRNNYTPPAGTYVFGPSFDGTLFIIYENRVYFSKPKRPEAWPKVNYIEVGTKQEPGKMGLFHGGQPFYLTLNNIFLIQGSGATSFAPLTMNSKCGVQSLRGAVSISGRGIYHTGPDGIYLWNANNDVKMTQDSLEPLFRGETKNGMPGVADLSTSWLFAYRNYLYFGYASVVGDYPVNVIRMDLQTDRISYFVYDDGTPVEIRALAIDDTNQRILIGDATGYLRVIEEPDYDDDSGNDIDWEAQSKDFTLQTRAHFPRWVKYDVDAANAESVTGALILDDSVHQSHIITGSRVTRRRLVTEGNGQRAAIRISGTGPAIVYLAEFE